MSRRLLLATTLLITLTLGVASLALAQDGVTEVPVTTIALAGPAAEQDAEVSGLTWYGDMLFLLAENPNIYATEGNAGMFYALYKADILAYLDADAPESLEPLAIQLGLPGEDACTWEGLACLDDMGFLIVTDKYPDTLLGFVPYEG